MKCDCPNPTLCERLQRHTRGRTWEIWTGNFTRRPLSPEKCEAYRQHWCDKAGIDIETVRHLNAPQPPPVCIHRGEHVGQMECKNCTSGGGMRDLYACDIHGVCSPRNFTPLHPRDKRPHGCITCDEFCC